MKILAVMEFPPASVPATHQKILRSLGIDYRIATKTAYMKTEVDWCLDVDYTEGLKEFAAQADIIQFHPSIGQPWSYQDLAPRFEEPEKEPFGPIEGWPDVPKIYYFHGSRNAEANAQAYKDHYGHRGHIWASTLDYVEWMDAFYAPPTFDYTALKAAPLRQDDDELIIVQSPTDPENCHTKEFIETCRYLGVMYRLMHRKPHSLVMDVKAQCNMGFDHMRGAFSVNTLENCALGLVPLVGLTETRTAMLEELTGRASPFYPMTTQLEQAISHFIENPKTTRLYQLEARRWAFEVMDPTWWGERMRRQYETIYAGT